MIALEPLQDRVLVKVKPLPEKTGSIHRVSVLRHEIAREADVIAVGPECRDVQPGQVVLLNSLAGQEVQDKLLVPESTILGFVE